MTKSEIDFRSTGKLVSILVALGWGLAQCFFLYFILTSEIDFRSNVFSLLVSENKDRPGDLQLGNDLLSAQGDKLRFVVSAQSNDHALEAAISLRERLAKTNQIEFINLPDKNILEDAFMSYLGNHRSLLLDSEQRALLKGGANAIIGSIKNKLYSPLASYYAEFLDEDPLLLLPEKILDLQSSPPGELIKGVLLHQNPLGNSANTHAASIFAKIPESLSIDAQGDLIEILNQTTRDIENEFKKSKVKWSGVLAFANSSAKRLRHDIQLLTTIGGILAVSILLVSFRSIYAVSLCFVSLFTGILSGVFFVTYLTGGIHLITLGIGISLMGACIDYSLHFISECLFGKPAGSKIDTIAARNKIAAPVFLGAATSALAFLSLSASSFPGLRELSLFALGSLLASSTTVIVWLPFFMKGKTKSPLALFNTLSEAPLRVSSSLKKARPIIALLASIVLLGGLALIDTSDDIRSLQNPDANLIATEKWMGEVTQRRIPAAYVIAAASDKQTVYSSMYAADAVLKSLRKQQILGEYHSLFSLVPPKEIQESNLKLFNEFLNENHSSLRSALSELGYKKELIEKALHTSTSLEEQYLDMQKLLDKLPEDIRSAIEPKKYGNSFYSAAIPIFAITNPDALKSTIDKLPNISYFAPAVDISGQFKTYRTQSSYLVLGAYLLIILFLYWRYSRLRCLRALLPLLMSVAVTFSLLGYISEPISFFSVLAVIIVLGLSVDFSIFLFEGKSHSKPVHIAVILSAISTIASFGLLAMSDTAVLHTIGLIVSLGVFSSLVFSLALVPNEEYQSQRLKQSDRE